jgi:anti-sigma28 factor (negative regulator of flagellin synthesis)
MKVTDGSQISALAPSKPDPVRAPVAGRTNETGDRVSTEDTAKITDVIRQARQSATAGHAARLQAIETAVKQGMYRPDPTRIAQQILDDAELAARLHALYEK